MAGFSSDFALRKQLVVVAPLRQGYEGQVGFGTIHSLIWLATPKLYAKGGGSGRNRTSDLGVMIPSL